MKPLLLVDVDGVLNAYYGGKASKGWERLRLGGFIVYLNKKHGEWLRGLADRFELTWGTTWEEEANLYISPALGLPDLPYVTFPESDEQTHKLRGVREYVGDRPCAWLDDDLGKDAHAWAKRRDRTIPTLFLDVDPKMCLLEHHIEKLEAFAERVQMGVDVSNDVSDR